MRITAGLAARSGIVRSLRRGVLGRGRPAFVALLALTMIADGAAAPAGTAPATTRAVAIPADRAASNDTRVGVNLDGIAAGRGGGIVFVDAMKQAAPWASDAAFVRDGDGNVVSLTPGHAAQTRTLAGESAPAGPYTLLYDGEGLFAFPDAKDAVVESSPGRMIVRLAPGTAGIRLRLSAVGKNYPHNIRLILPGYADTYRIQPFTPAYLELASRFDVLRFAQWSQRTAPPHPAEWSSRAGTSRFTQADGRGVALEFQIALANEAGASPWLTIPSGASDDYVVRMAALVHAGLDPRLHPIFEYGDETWRHAPSANAAAFSDAAARSAHAMELITRTYGSDAGRVTRVLSIPGTSAGSPQAMLLDRLLRAAAATHAFDAVAVAADTGPVDGTLAAARAVSLPLYAYAGGVHLPNAPALRALYDGQLEAWHATGGGLYVERSLIGPWGRNGAGGVLERIDVAPSTAYALQGIADFAFRHPALKIRPLPPSFNAPLLAPSGPVTPKTAGARVRVPGTAPQTISIAVSSTTFSPTQLTGLAGWYDPSDTASVVFQTGSTTYVAQLNDKSGAGNTMIQTTTTHQPGLVRSGIGGLPSLSFAGQQFLLTSNTAMSGSLFNESSVFVVTNQSATAQDSSVLWTGAYGSNPRFKFALTDPTLTTFDFNNSGAGMHLTASTVATAPALWSLGSGVSAGASRISSSTFGRTAAPSRAGRDRSRTRTAAIRSHSAVAPRH